MRSRLSGLASSSALGRTGPQVREQLEALAQPEKPLLRARRVGVGGVPLRPADRGEQHRVGGLAGVEHLVGERGSVRVDRRAADEVLGHLEAAERGRAAAARRP